MPQDLNHPGVVLIEGRHYYQRTWYAESVEHGAKCWMCQRSTHIYMRKYWCSIRNEGRPVARICDSCYLLFVKT